MIAAPAGAGSHDILFWAPYGAGDAEQAAATMEEFARYVEKAAGWPEGSASATYSSTVDGDLGRLQEDPPGYVIVTAPIYLRHHAAFGWRAMGSLITDTADAQRYSVYGPAGSTLASLEGAPLTGDTAYDAAFVAGIVLGRAEVGFELVPTDRPLSAVRKAARGESIAVLLDEGQRRALDSLPTGDDLVLLAESIWMPAGILAAGEGVSAEAAEKLMAALERAADDPAAEPLFHTMRIRRFEPVDPEVLAALDRAYGNTKDLSPTGRSSDSPAGHGAP